jgi:hypothetical protein
MLFVRSLVFQSSLYLVQRLAWTEFLRNSRSLGRQKALIIYIQILELEIRLATIYMWSTSVLPSSKSKHVRSAEEQSWTVLNFHHHSNTLNRTRRNVVVARRSSDFNNGQNKRLR